MAIIGGIRSYTPVPIDDMIDGFLGFFSNGYYDHISAWWWQHNEHRTVLSRILFWLDIVLFQGKLWFLTVVNYLLMGISYLFFYMMLKERLSTEKDAFPLKVLSLVILIMLVSWIQQDNFVRAFQNGFFLAQLLPLIAFFLLHRAYVNPVSSTRLFILACLTGVASLGSMANGVLTLPLMALFALILRMSWHRVIILMILAVIGNLLYFHNYITPPQHNSLIDTVFNDPVGLLIFVLYYLGGPFYYITGEGNFNIPVLAAIFLIASAVFFTWKSIKKPATSSLEFALLSFLLYIGIAAVGTGGGRVSLGLEQAFTSRYQTPVLMAWATLIILYAPAIARGINHAPRQVLGALMLIPLILLPIQRQALQSQQSILFEEQIGALALELGINDQEQIVAIYPFPEKALKNTRTAVEEGFSIFGRSPLEKVNQLIGRSEEYRSFALCQGYLDNIYNMEHNDGYVRVRGWLFQPDARKSPSKIHILNEEGRIIGYALTGQPRPDVAIEIDPEAKESGYVGYLMTQELGRSIILRGYEPDCELMIPAPQI
jgi:hypothetical protein